MQVFGGRVYVGYGDYTADTGPIAIAAIDLATGAIGAPLLSYATEAVQSYRAIGQELFAPDLDPRRTRLGGFARGVAGTSAELWTDEKVVPATHIFDIASFDGRDLWLFGSLGDNAMAWRSVDGGRTWTTSLSIAPLTRGSFSRMYGAFVLEGRLFTQAVDYPGGPQPQSKVFDGDRWRDGPTLIPREAHNHDVFPWRPQVVGRQAIYLDQHSGTTYRVVRAYRFDGDRARLTFGPRDRHDAGDPQFAVVDVTVSGNSAYVLNRLQQVWSSDDLVEWRRRADFAGAAGESATSIAVSGADLYVGTSLSNVYRLRLSR